MNEEDRLQRELRAAREELVRKQSRSPDPDTTESQHPLMHDRDEQFLRLALMTVDELETHIERLERDVADLRHGFYHPDE